MYADRISDNNALIQHGFFEESTADQQHVYGDRRPDRPDRYSMLHTPPTQHASAARSASSSIYPTLHKHQLNTQPLPPSNHPHHQPLNTGGYPSPPSTNQHASHRHHHLHLPPTTNGSVNRTATRTIAISTRRSAPPPVLYEYRLYENSFDDHHFASPLAPPTPLALPAATATHYYSRNRTTRKPYYDNNIAEPQPHHSPNHGRRQPLGQSDSTYIQQQQLQQQHQQQQHQHQLYRSYNNYYHAQQYPAADNGRSGALITYAAQPNHHQYYAAASTGARATHTTSTDAYDDYGYPVKMQCEEVIIEHSQLVSIGNHNNNNNSSSATAINGGHRPGGLPAGGGLLPAYYSTQIIAALAVSLGPLAAGLGKGYSSPAIDSLQELSLRPLTNDSTTTFTVSDQQASWVASLSLLGALFGGMFGGLAMQYGRRRLLTLMSLPFSLSWILTVFAKSVETMFATAFLGGFCCSIISMVTQVYISEIASPDIRGFLSAIQKMSGHLGIIISFSLGAYLNWRQLAMLVSVAPMMLFLTVIYIPETPSWLVLKGREQEAYRSLQWLRGPHSNVELELETIKANVRATRLSAGRFTSTTVTAQNCMSKASMDVLYANVKAVLRNARLVRPILITCGLMVFQRFTGANSFNFYAVKIFRRTFAGMNPHGVAVSVSFVQLLASMVSGLLIDIVGRIPLLIISSVFMSLAMACFGSFVYYNEEANRVAAANFDLDAAAATAGNSDWIPLLCVLVFAIAFSLGISPISSLLVSELFPLEYRGIGSSIATSFSHFCAFISVKTFVDFQEGLGLHGAFWLYALISCIGLIFVVLFVPETKGKDLEEMDPKLMRTVTLNR